MLFTVLGNNISFILYLCLFNPVLLTFKLQYIMYIIRNYVLCKRCTEPGLLQRNTVCENLYTYAVNRYSCKYVLNNFFCFSVEVSFTFGSGWRARGQTPKGK